MVEHDRKLTSAAIDVRTGLILLGHVGSHLRAYDAKLGTLLWHCHVAAEDSSDVHCMAINLDLGLMFCGVTDGCVPVMGGTNGRSPRTLQSWQVLQLISLVFMGTSDGTTTAWECETGELVWRRSLADWDDGNLGSYKISVKSLCAD